MQKKRLGREEKNKMEKELTALKNLLKGLLEIKEGMLRDKSAEIEWGTDFFRLRIKEKGEIMVVIVEVFPAKYTKTVLGPEPVRYIYRITKRGIRRDLSFYPGYAVMRDRGKDPLAELKKFIILTSQRKKAQVK